MDFSISALAAGLIFGIIGIFVFRSGKASGNWKLLVIGIALMLFPYFTPGAAWIDWVVGAILSLAAYRLA